MTFRVDGDLSWDVALQRFNDEEIIVLLKSGLYDEHLGDEVDLKTLLQRAIQSKRRKIIAYAITACPDQINKRTRCCETPLELVLGSKPVDFMLTSFLLRAGADVAVFNNAVNEYGHPLLFDVHDARVLNYLLCVGASSAVLARDGTSLLERALIRVDLNSIDVLKRHGCENVCDARVFFHLCIGIHLTIRLIDSGHWPHLRESRRVWARINRVAFEILYLAGLVDLSCVKKSLDEAFAVRPYRPFENVYCETTRAAMCALSAEVFSDDTMRRMNRVSIHAVGHEATRLCMALHELELPALMMSEILHEHFAATWPNIRLHIYYLIAKGTKHFFDVVEQKTKRRAIGGGD